MPFFPALGCAFIHVPKTAGTSIVRALSGADAEFAESGIWDILERHDARVTIAEAIRRNFRLASFVSFPQQHLPAAAMRILLGERWARLERFAVVRNPWDMLVSTYAFARAHAPTVRDADPDRSALMARSDTFERFVELYPLLRGDMTEMLADEHGNLLVGDVLRFERLDDDLAAIAERLGVRLTLGRENASARDAQYRSYFTPRTQRLAAAHFERDIERFEYSF
ncbi:MAG: sulfotransferase family 2 domain-containing protein [bacterium]|nr:sulfotransferase family 2 domain-containing protein [bacterium]